MEIKGLKKIIVIGTSKSTFELRNRLIDYLAEIEDDDIDENILFIAMGCGYKDRTNDGASLADIDSILNNCSSYLKIMPYNDDPSLFPYYGYKNIDFIDRINMESNILILPKIKNNTTFSADAMIVAENSKSDDDIGIVICNTVPHTIDHSIPGRVINADNGNLLDSRIQLTSIHDILSKYNSMLFWLSPGDSYTEKHFKDTKFIQLSKVNTFEL